MQTPCEHASVSVQALPSSQGTNFCCGMLCVQTLVATPAPETHRSDVHGLPSSHSVDFRQLCTLHVGPENPGAQMHTPAALGTPVCGSKISVRDGRLPPASTAAQPATRPSSTPRAGPEPERPRGKEPRSPSLAVYQPIVNDSDRRAFQPGLWEPLCLSVTLQPSTLLRIAASLACVQRVVNAAVSPPGLATV